MSSKVGQVIFSGENPSLTLYEPGGGEVIARASYWKCVYSEAGDGNVIFLWLDASVAGRNGSSRSSIITDNPGMASIVFDNMNRHFGDWGKLGFDSVEPTRARFFQEGDGRWYHRVVSNSDDEIVVLRWWEMIEQQLTVRQNFELGPSRFDLATVICPCRSAEILVSNQPVPGEVRVTMSDDGSQSSSAFLAFSETWRKY